MKNGVALTGFVGLIGFVVFDAGDMPLTVNRIYYNFCLHSAGFNRHQVFVAMLRNAPPVGGIII